MELPSVVQTEYEAYTNVYFRVTIVTQLGEVVLVTGDDKNLGNWDPVKGHELVSADGNRCWYSSEAVSLPIKIQVKYKYVILDSDRRLVRWEETYEDRIIVPTGEEMVQEDDNAFYRHKIPLPYRTNEETDCEAAAESAVRQDLQHQVADKLRALKDTELEVNIDERDTVFLVSSELPLKVVRTANTAKGNISQGSTMSCESYEYQVVKQKYLFLPMLHQLRTRVTLPVKFIGWPGIDARDDEEKKVIEKLLEPFGCIPVFPPVQQFQQYLMFCFGFLWSTFHNIHIYNVHQQAPFDTEQWNCYQNVNRIWAEAVVHNAHETDLIWVNDFTLLLTPQYITRRIRRANVGFFLHTPFPSSEIFRSLPVCEEILRGMLCADLIGFQFFEYARHFLVACKRLLGLEHHFRLGGFLAIEYAGRYVSIKIGHVHIQYNDLRAFVEGSPLVQSLTCDIRQNYDGKFIFASVDRCDPLAGLILKIRAFQHFLRNYPYARHRAVLIQYAYPMVGPWDDSAPMRQELLKLVAEVNREFAEPTTGGIRAQSSSDRESSAREMSASPVIDSLECGGIATHTPPDMYSGDEEMIDLNGPSTDGHIVLYINPVTPEEKYGLFRASDCLLDTSIKDGLNLNPFDYICCCRDSSAEIILSEFTGSSRALVSALRVNPWKPEAVAAMMDRAMNAPFEESRDKFLRDQTYLQINSTLGWAEDFLRELRRARKQDDVLYVSWGFANTYRVLGLDLNFRHLDLMNVVVDYRRSRRRVFFFDHEGTLAADKRRITAVPGCDNLFAQGSPPSEHTKACLRTLAADPLNTIVILSGRDQKLLESWFGDIEGLGLCAEHGYYFTVPKITGNEWYCTSKQNDFTWKHIATELMQNYVKRTQGSIIENKGSALVFQYRDADLEFGSWQAKELSSHLIEMLFGYPVTVMSGKGYVEVKLSGVNKGRAVHTVLSRLKKFEEREGSLDFVLCIGDDRTDEEMFAAIQEMYGAPPQQASTHCEDYRAMSPLGRRFSSQRSESLMHDYKTDYSLKGRSETIEESNPDHVSTGHKKTVTESPTVTTYTVTVGKKPSNAKFYVNDVDEVSDLLQSLQQLPKDVRLSIGTIRPNKSNSTASNIPTHDDQVHSTHNPGRKISRQVPLVGAKKQSVTEFFTRGHKDRFPTVIDESA